MEGAIQQLQLESCLENKNADSSNAEDKVHEAKLDFFDI